jgi:cytochrome c oxidase subunit II
MKSRLAIPAAVTGLLAGCSGPQSALDPAGPTSEALAQAWWIMFWGATAIFVLTIGLALYAALRNPERRIRISPLKFVIGLGLVFPTVTLVALLVYGVRLGQSVLPTVDDPGVYVIDVRGHQWWWEISYPNAVGGIVLHSANELHIPVGRPVIVRITSNDVIHSFWVPQLGYKIDGTPGLISYLRIEASRPGVFRGQCAEFCGAQHARMRMLVHAHEPDELERKLVALAQSGDLIRQRASTEAMVAFGEHCQACHSIDPGERGSGIGPNLADLAQRSTLGAGTLLNSENNLRRWMWDHQSLKPGSRKPIHAHLEPDLMESIIGLLEARQ